MREKLLKEFHIIDTELQEKQLEVIKLEEE